MGRAILLGLTLCLLSGCADQYAKEAAKLSQACQVTKCDCASNFMTLFGGTESLAYFWKNVATMTLASGRQGKKTRAIA